MKKRRPLRILHIGDVVGRAGRGAVARWLPELRKKEGLDFVIANVENLAHGKGVTEKTLNELLASGVDYCTSGDHILDKDEGRLLADEKIPVLRPANFPDGAPGRGSATVRIGESKALIVNLIGRVFFKQGTSYGSPFTVMDEMLDTSAKDCPIVIVDFHAEATSEKIAMGWYVDGRVTSLFGTHTHVPTDDLRILPGGTAYRTDIGMTGLRDEVLGAEKGIILHNFLNPQATLAHRWTEEGPVQFHAVLVELDPTTGRSLAVERIDRESAA